tara:strand:- start:350 stop:475 length:126 start_codon:yes stop_codon:yes gene_type:complete
MPLMGQALPLSIQHIFAMLIFNVTSFNHHLTTNHQLGGYFD